MAHSMQIASVQPTVFFVHHGDALRQLVRVSVENSGNEREASLVVRADGVDESWSLGAVASGKTECEAFLPDIRLPTQVWLGLWADGVLQDERSIAWQPQKHWEVYLVLYSHHDLGYTDLPSNVLREQADFMDQVLRYCEETEDWPEESKFRYLCEQAWSVVHFVENRPEDVVKRLVHFIKNRQIEVTALFGNQTTELCGHEELVRLLYPAFRLKRDYGIDIATAEHNDIPGFSWGLASVLAGAGVKYFSPGVPMWYFGRGERRVHPCWDESAVLPIEVPGAFWWEGPDGARVLLWYDLHGDEWHPTSYQHALRELPEMLRSFDESGCPYDMMSYTLRGGRRDNSPPTLRYAYIAKEWNNRWAYPRLITATNKRFLEAFERKWGSTLKILRGELPNTDYTVGATCTPKETAVNRNAHDWLLTAEKLATLASIVAGHEYPGSVLDEAYRHTFCYDLHAWGMAHPGGPAQDGSWSEKGGFAYRAAALAHDVILKASNKIVDEIAYPEDGSYYLTVFNTLSWEHTGVVRVAMRTWAPCSQPVYWKEPRQEDEGAVLVAGRAIGRGIIDPPPSLLERPFELVDVSTGGSVPYQVTSLTDPQAAQPWAPERFALGKVDSRYLSEIVFVAEGLPAMGYKTYRVVPCEQSPEFAVACEAAGAVLENRFFRLQLDPQTGAIVRLLDKALGRDLVDRDAAHGFAQMIVRWCETGEEETSRITDVSVSEVGPVYTTIRLKGEVSGCPRWTEEVTLYNALKRIDINVRMLRDSTPMLELYVAFPFQVETPRFRFEATGSVIEPTRDQLPGSNTDYYAMQHWADVFNDEWGVVWTPVDTPVVEFGGLWPGYVSGAQHGVTPPGYGHAFLRPGELKRGHIYSLVMCSNFRTNFSNVHPGEMLLRYAFSTHKGDWQAGRAHEFGWNVANPPSAVWMKGPKDGALPSSASFCQIDAPNVMLLTFKRAEDGNGYIIRLMETEGKRDKTTVTMPCLSILHAFETNLVEENQRLLPCNRHSVETTLKPFAVATIRLVTER
jgi:alpha-mannosidase